MSRRPPYQRGTTALSGRTPGRRDASIDGGRPSGHRRQRRAPENPTWRCRDRLSQLLACLAPLNRGGLNSTHFHGTRVPVEEPSTASIADIHQGGWHVRFVPKADIIQLGKRAYSITSSAGQRAYLRPQSRMARTIGPRSRPFAVRTYSARGGLIE